MGDWWDSIEPHYAWLIGGLLLATAEMVVPGYFLIWLAAAALLVGLLTAALPLGTEFQIGLFALFSFAAIMTGRRYLRRHPIESADPLLNHKGARMIGQKAVVTEAIEGGRGRVHVGDSDWMASGPDTPIGRKVVITGIDNATLIVEDVP